MSGKGRRLFPVMALVLGLVPAPGLHAKDLPLNAISDDSGLRALAGGLWLDEGPAPAPGGRGIHVLPGGERVQVAVMSGVGESRVILARASAAGQYSGWEQGSWEFTRAARETAVRGEGLTSVRVFPRSDRYVFLRFTPFGRDRSQMDVLVYDAFLVAGLVLPVSLERLSLMPLRDIIALAGNDFPVRFFRIDPDDYLDQRRLVADIRRRLPDLAYAPDGAMDSEGNFVLITSGLPQEEDGAGLSHSGFAKWVVDGMLRPVSGERLDIADLTVPFGGRGSSFTRPFEHTRDPFFGLDWIRNLARNAWSALRSPEFATLTEFEVRRQPFSRLMLRNPAGAELRSFPGFIEDLGYGIEGLLPLLYVLAVEEPGRFFLAAVNADMHPPETEAYPRGGPRLRHFFHVAALIPYFDA
ncbi:MAG: hypothetical protein FWD94_05700, partial [Treponema sp.]|nr:hypothetical protein [Treponema sp.]